MQLVHAISNTTRDSNSLHTLHAIAASTRCAKIAEAYQLPVHTELELRQDTSNIIQADSRSSHARQGRFCCFSKAASFNFLRLLTQKL